MPRLLLIASYEIRRVWRPRDYAITIAMTVAIALVFHFVQGKDDEEARRLAYLGPAPSAVPGFEFVSVEDEDEARQQVEERELDGLLDLREAEAPRLVARKQGASWQTALEASLAAVRTHERAGQLGLAPDQLAVLLQPLELEVEAISTRGKRQLISALLVVGAMIFALFGGSAYLFTGITGEKRRRVTETLVAIVPPQTWIDGKILGLGVVAMNTLVHVGLGWGTFHWTRQALGADMRLPDLPIGLADMVPFVGIALPGFAFWFCFLAAFCATIHDPETSTRSSILMLPAVILALPLLFLDRPDGQTMQILSYLPPTASSALPLRMILDEVRVWEYAVSFALLCAGVWILRLAAGRIFTMSMLLHGSEPSLKDMWRAATSRPGMTKSES